MARTSVVGSIKINTVILGSIFQTGDNVEIKAKAYVFAVQRARAEFQGNEGNLAEYPIFSVPIPLPDSEDTVRVKMANHYGLIAVRHVTILGMSSSAVFQVGTNRIMELETRVKHIRQLEPRGRGAAPSPPARSDTV